ncbi:meiosis-specific cohesin subunit SMC1 beta [Oryzias latipes]|uniref:Meiosis-specific cohesin subunit SMC1 beta n=1 Tax=Oryzias latipes TaxID=8090 RepID=Q765Q4_ORYLA|nr:structural maintenance of chromosomes 1B [Oryzias latipes]BAD08304.1 meiosis-specific cohesin subunit SMC1 beta [Oryzias latipes]
MGYLKQLDIENFKSWRGKHVIGPFMKFSCIIGTNGSGKSNVMDALSFAIGERAASLRVKHLRDLIHGANVGRPISDTARVAVRYCDDQERETVFCRIITGVSTEWQINGVRVTLAKYIEELEKLSIMTKVQNCMVFQGTVEVDCFEGSKGEDQNVGKASVKSRRTMLQSTMQRRHALLKAKEDTQFHFNKKKSATVEKKQVSQEKLEAQKYQELLDELHENRFSASLSFTIMRRLSIPSVITERTAERCSSEETGNLEQMVKVHKKEHGHLTREQQHTEKEIRDQEHGPSLGLSTVKAKVNTSHHMKKIEEGRCAVKKKRKCLTHKQQQLKEDQLEITELEKAWKSYEKQVQQEGASKRRDIELNEDQVERYDELKKLVHKQGAVFSQQAEKLQWELKANSEKIAFDQRRKKEMEIAIRNSLTHLEDMTSRSEKLKEYIKSCTSSLEDCCQKEEKLSAELQWAAQRSVEVNHELTQVMEELGNARLDSHESRRQLQRRKLLENFVRLFPENVYGRLSDLCSPIHKKYQLAVTKVFGSNMNAIVVSSEKTARDCISFMKAERAEPETFLPIDYLVVSPLNERLREIPGAKMVVDVVQFNMSTNAAQLKKVVQYVCGNALVCESIKDARSLAFDQEQRVKTVSLDGTLFKTSGVISGGSSYLRTKARCWEEKDVKLLKERKEHLTSELRDLMRKKRKESELKQISAQAQGARTRLKYSKADLEHLEKKAIPKCQAEISRLESEPRPQEIHKCSLKLQREVMSAESALEQKRLARHTLLLACKIKGLPIILLSGTLMKSARCSLEPDSESTCSHFDHLERGAAPHRLLLTCSHSLEVSRRRRDGGCTEKLRESVSNTEESYTTPQHPTGPGENEEVRTSGRSDRCLSQHQSSKKCSLEFEQVKAQRFHRFSRCLEHVSVVIDQIYKRICKNSSAQAILTAECADEPYLGGINFNLCGSGRFMSMDNLSGGEKAIAALAFLFAVQSFCPAPFLVLDEVDAALDNSNIGKVTSFIREQSRQSMQVIAISHKQEFFSRSDGLLGVYSDVDECMFSRILTLDLRPYPLVEEEDGKQTDDRGQDSLKETA